MQCCTLLDYTAYFTLLTAKLARFKKTTMILVTTAERPDTFNSNQFFYHDIADLQWSYLMKPVDSSVEGIGLN